MFERALSAVEKRVLRLPWWLFWGLFMALAWFYIIRRIIDWDLWWHMASGRYMLEHGKFPTSEVFSFGVVNPGQNVTSFAWLGDLILHLLYRLGGFTALQLLRAGCIFFAVLVFLRACRFRLNPWTLLAATMVAIGTMQKHLEKNAIFSMIFLSTIVLFWLLAIYERKEWLLWLIIPIILVWNEIHGDVLVAIWFLFFALVGDVLDTAARAVFAWWRKKPVVTNFLRQLVLIVVLVVSYRVVNPVWNMDLGSYVNKWTDSVKSLILSEQGSVSQKEAAPLAFGRDDNNPQRKDLRRYMRIVFQSIDAEIVAEYQWPLDIPYVLCCKLTFLLVLLYVLALAFRLALSPGDIRLSVEIPCLAFLYLGMGYLRNTGYPFLMVLPCLGYCLHKLWVRGPELRNAAFSGGVLLGFSLLVLFVFAAFDLPWLLVKLMCASMAHSSMEWLYVPLVCLVPATGVVLLIEQGKWFALWRRSVAALAGAYILCCLAAFAVYENYKWVSDEFHAVTGFLDTEPGIGKSNKFFKPVAEYVEKQYPNERIFNTYNMGGYLIWQWYGKRQVLIDGRSAIYESNFYRDYTSGNLGPWMEKFKLNKAILNLLVDRDRLEAFLQSGWEPVVFDSCLVLMVAPRQPMAAQGTIPVFVEGERDLERLERLDLQAMGGFLLNVSNWMLKYGRLHDARVFHDANQRMVFDKLPQLYQEQLKSRRELIGKLEERFGSVNNPALGTLCRKLFDHVQGVDYHQSVADALLAVGRPEHALAELQQALRIKADDPALLTRFGDVAWQVKNFRLAADAYQSALKTSKSDASLYNNLGLCLLQLEKLPEAAAALQRAVELAPGNLEMRFNLAVLLIRRGERENAEQELQKVLKARPDHPQALRQLEELRRAPAPVKPPS